MGTRHQKGLSFEARSIIQPIFTGGDSSIDSSGTLLAGSVGEDALITNISTGETLCRIDGDGEVLTALQITPSASHIVLCSRSLSMRIYGLQRREDTNLIEASLSRTLKPHNTPVVTASIDHTGTLLATGSADGAVKVWDVRGGYSTHTFRGHSGIVSALRFFEVPASSRGEHIKPRIGSKDGRGESESEFALLEESRSGTNAAFRLASGGDDGNIRIWDLARRKVLSTLSSHVSVVRGLDFSASQNALVSSSRDKTLVLWDARTWKARKIIPALEVLEDSVFANGGNFICTGGESGHIRVWHTDSGREITTEQEIGNDSDTIVKLMAPSTSEVLIAINAEQTLAIHDLGILASKDEKYSLDSLPLLRRISGTHDEVIDLVYLTSSQKLLALATNTENVRILSVETDGPASSQNQYFGSDVGLLEGHEEIIICLDTDWSGCWLATGAKDNTARLWRIDAENQSFTCHAVFTGHAESIGAVGLPKLVPHEDSAAYHDPLSNPPPFLITGSQDKTVKHWTTASLRKGERKGPKALYTRRAHDKDINAISVNHVGNLFASASQDKTVKIWSVEEGEVQGILKGHKRGVWSVAFAPKSTPTVLGDEAGRSSSGRGMVLTGSGDKTVKIWSLSDYSCLRTFEGHTNSVLKVLWLPPRQLQPDSNGLSDETSVHNQQNSAVAVSAGSDGLVRLWDVQSGEPVTTLDNHTDRIWALAAHSKNGDIVSGGADSVITFWKDITAKAAADRVSAATQRVEQEQELSNHVHRGNYREAIVLALTLNHPGRLLALFSSITRNRSEVGSLSGLRAVDEVLASLSDDQLFTLLLRLRDWNTNARTASVAQRILGAVVKSHSRERIVGLAQAKGRGGLGDVLEALKSYTERHYRRMEELVEESYIVDFVVRGMGEEAFTEEQQEPPDVLFEAPAPIPQSS